VIVRATERLNSLIEFRYRRIFKARNGQPGRGKNQSGKDGEDVVIDVPPGTIIQEAESDEILTDLVRDDQSIVLLKGGRGGRGNQHFATSTSRAPRKAQPGQPGEEKRLKLTLKYLADIGLIGLPNAGKSTLLSRMTAARPRIAEYPFTTLAPNLGVIALDDEKSLTVADIPGLIEGASRGRGLGHGFLKHIERTKLLLHLIDITYVPESGLIEDFERVKMELEAYSALLAQKHQIVLINKMDLYSSKHRDVEKVKKALQDKGYQVFPVSALTGEGLEKVKEALAENFFDGK
jgi:GTP-binding protein